jgi:AcrR family transcriptional regulator
MSFIERGFGDSTIRQVADDAKVSQETIYKTFGGKAALLKAVYDVSLAGDDNPIPLAERPEAIAVRDARSPAEAATAYSELAQLIASRIEPLLRVLLGSRDTDPALAEFARTTEKERHLGSTFFVRHWATTGWPATTSPSTTQSTPSGSQLAPAPLAPTRSRLDRGALHRVARQRHHHTVGDLATNGCTMHPFGAIFDSCPE